MMIELEQPSIKDHFAILIPDIDKHFVELMHNSYKIAECYSYQLLITEELYNANKDYFDSIVPNVIKTGNSGDLPLDYYKPEESEYQSIKKLHTSDNKKQVKQYMCVVPMKLTKKMLEYLNSL